MGPVLWSLRPSEKRALSTFPAPGWALVLSSLVLTTKWGPVPAVSHPFQCWQVLRHLPLS